MTLYNNIGSNYNQTRNADTRIYNILISLLGCNQNEKILDVGAGTGNYSFELANVGYHVFAVEPSDLMIRQGRKHDNIKWIQGFAENLPFEDHYFDGAICTLASHHFESLKNGFEEIHRVIKKKGKFVLFTQDPRLIEDSSWFKEYLKIYYLKAFENMPEIEKVKDIIEKIFCTRSLITDFNLPFDLKDGFFYSAWKFPEKYLDSDFRNGISIFSITESVETEKIISLLKNDLLSGKWDEKYSFYRNKNEFNGGYYFLSIEKT